MKAVMFVNRGQTAIVEEDMPVCAADTMLLKTLYSGLSNGTERSFLMGGPYGGQTWPTRIAYQLVSEVIECGPEITDFKIGDLLYTGTFAGHVQYHVAKESDLIVKLPEGFDLEEAALLGVASVSFHNVLRAQVKSQDKVLVVGDGLIGQFAAQGARITGARVTVAGHHHDRLMLADSLGADAVIDTTTETGNEALQHSAPYSVVFECSGADVLDQIIGMPDRPGLIGKRAQARLVLVAGRFEVRYNFVTAGRTEVAILHSQHFDQSDLEQVICLVARDDIRIRPLIRDVVPIDDAVRIFDTLRDDRSSLLGTIFKFD